MLVSHVLEIFRKDYIKSVFRCRCRCLFQHLLYALTGLFKDEIKANQSTQLILIDVLFSLSFLIFFLILTLTVCPDILLSPFIFVPPFFPSTRRSVLMHAGVPERRRWCQKGLVKLSCWEWKARGPRGE